MNTFTLNGNVIVAKEFNFNTLVEFDNYGISIQDITDKPLAFVRAYVAHCMGSTLDEAGQSINDHIVSGGNLNDIFDAINREMESSGFFRALQSEPKEVQAQAPKSTKKAK